MTMDNHSINYTARMDEQTLEHIRCALTMMLAGDDPKRVTHYSVDSMVGDGIAFDSAEVETLILYTCPESDATAFAFPQSLDDLSRFIYGWLSNATYGPEPDIDGDCEEGYRLFTDEYGEVGSHSSALIAAQPMWAIIHK